MAINRNLSILAQGASSTGNLLNYTGANKIINGDMAIDQRNAGASVTPTTGQYGIDRWRSYLTAASKYSVQQNAAAVTPPAGFTYYLGVTSLSAYSLAAGDYFAQQQYVEGLNCTDLNWGTANAKTVTMSFWVRSSLTGTHGGAMMNSAGTRSYPFTYTISVANTWEYKTVTIPGDTSGTWLTTNGRGIEIDFGLGVGTTYSGTAGAWAAGLYISATGAVSVVGTNAATWYVTGVKFEVGTVATPFVPDDYSVSLGKCQRYYQIIAYGGSDLISGAAYASGQIYAALSYKVQFRATPTITLDAAANWNVAGYGAPSSVTAGASSTGGYLNISRTGPTLGDGITAWGSTNAVIGSAEL